MAPFEAIKVLKTKAEEGSDVYARVAECVGQHILLDVSGAVLALVVRQ